MNGAQAHLLLNHLPVFGVVFGLIILFYAIFRKSEEMKRVALGLFVLTALALVAWTAYLGGQIHHPEIRAGFQMEGQNEGEGAEAAEDRIGEGEQQEHEEDED